MAQFTAQVKPQFALVTGLVSLTTIWLIANARGHKVRRHPNRSFHSGPSAKGV
jgi:hypothetical protein